MVENCILSGKTSFFGFDNSLKLVTIESSLIGIVSIYFLGAFFILQS